MDFVLRTFPRHLSEDVACDTDIRVDFMVDLNSQLLREEHIVLWNVTEQKPVSIRYEYRSRTLIIKPRESLSPRMHYQLQLVGGEKGIRDIIGRYMPESYQIEFFTKDVDGIKPPVLLTPTHLSEVTEKPTFTWSAVEHAYAYELQISSTNTFHNVTWPPSSQLIFGTSVKPDVKYERGRYYARIRAIAEDGTKSAFSDVIQFYVNINDSQKPPETNFPIRTNTRIEQNSQLTVLKQYFSQQNQSSSEKLRIVSSSPKHRSSHFPVAKLQKIIVEFNEPLDPNSVTSQSCYITEEKN